ncbi:hypothetical protein C1N76_06280 [Geobacillus thermoleovorans]|uniref:Uncharacterized protein n=1 Tax=Geobacillus thermoleovorans TaxID=33941 RepID=A0A2Z3N5K0_GEOTH|nr:hypothetical protein C1N76_06280 [Geobacillus thermoleovorans]
MLPFLPKAAYRVDSSIQKKKPLRTHSTATNVLRPYSSLPKALARLAVGFGLGEMPFLIGFTPRQQTLPNRVPRSMPDSAHRIKLFLLPYLTPLLVPPPTLKKEHSR